MNDFDKVLKCIQRVLDTRSSYQVAKDLGISNRTINRYQNGTTPLDNMTIATARIIYNYYEEMRQMEKETLDQAIKDFNEWPKGAALYFRTNDRTFDVEVFHSDVFHDQTVFAEHCVVVYSKRERSGHMQIGKQRREYIEKYIDMLDDGWEPHQIEYHLAAPGIY